MFCLFKYFVVRDVSVVEGVVVFAQDEGVVQRQDVLASGQDQCLVAGHASASRKFFQFRFAVLQFRSFDGEELARVFDLDHVVEVALVVLQSRNFWIVFPVSIDSISET